MCLGCQKVSGEAKNERSREDTKSSFSKIEFSTYDEGWESEETNRSISGVSNGTRIKAVKSGSLHRNDFTTHLPEERSVEPRSQVLCSNEEKTGIPTDKTEGDKAYPPVSVRTIIPLEALRTAPSSSPAAWRQISLSKTQTRHLTLLSDWANLFDGCESGFTKSGSLVMQKSPSLSGSFLHEWLTSRESRLAVVIVPKKIRVPPGNVMGMFHTKKNYLFQILNLDSTFDEVVDLFLCKESGNRLPVSFSKTEAKRPTIMTTTRMRTTLSENLGPKFDAGNEGLCFTIGCVNSGACYKMNLVELSMIERVFSLTCPENLPDS